MITTLPGFDIGALVDAGLSLEEQDDWHAPEPCPRGCFPRRAKRDCPDCHGEGQIWYWHASSLAFCTRAAVLKRAGLAPDGTPRSGLMTFALGHAIHDRLERWAKAYALVEPRFEFVGNEIGGLLDFGEGARLKAKCDILGRWDGQLSVFEIKSEKLGADKWRAKEAESLGYDFPVKYEHWLQATCQGLALEQETWIVRDPETRKDKAIPSPIFGETISVGRTVYVQKNDWWIDAYPVDLGDADMRAEVRRRTLELEAAWRDYRSPKSVLPTRLPMEGGRAPWQCSTRTPMERDGDNDPRGRFCPARSVCMARP